MQSPPAVSGRPVLNAIHLGVSFCFVFMSFSVSQNFQTSSDHKKQGSTALGILYACFTFSNFFSSFIVSTIGSKLSLILGAGTYVAFVAANIKYWEPTLYLFSGLLGLGASVLWTAQGAYISNCAALHERAHGLPIGSTLGFFNGTFFSIFQVNMVVGSLLAALLFKLDVDVGTIFVVMTAICGFGAATLTCLKDPAKALPLTRGQYTATTTTAAATLLSQAPSGVGEEGLTHPASSPSSSQFPESYSGLSTPPATDAWSRFTAVFESLRMLVEVKMLVMIPLMIYSGLSQTFIVGDFPLLIDDRAMKYFVLAVLGAADAASSMAMGRLSDRYGRVVVLAIGFVTALGSILFLGLWSTDHAQTAYVFFLVGGVLGVSDGVFNTQIYAILGCWYEGRAEQAFANFKLFQAGSTAFAFLIDNQIGFEWKCWMTAGALVVGYLVLTGYDLACRRRGADGKSASLLDVNGDPTTDDDMMDGTGGGVTSPMLQSAYGSPELTGHSSASSAFLAGNSKQRADSLHLDSTQVGAYRPIDL